MKDGVNFDTYGYVTFPWGLTMIRILLSSIFVCLFSLNSILFINTGLAQEGTGVLDGTITLNVKAAPIKDVLVEFSKQTNWHVLLDANLENEQLSGSFSQEPIDSFITKILKGKNLIVLYDSNQKIIDIRSFGDKRPRAFLISKGQLHESPLSMDEQDLFVSHANALSQLQANKDELNSKELLTGTELGAITTLHHQQHKAHEDYLNNPGSIEPFTGATLGSITALQNQQQKAHEAHLNNPDSIEPLTGIRLGAIAALQTQQQKDYADYISNPSSIDPLTGISLGTINERQQQQKKAINEQQPVPNIGNP